MHLNLTAHGLAFANPYLTISFLCVNLFSFDVSPSSKKERPFKNSFNKEFITILTHLITVT